MHLLGVVFSACLIVLKIYRSAQNLIEDNIRLTQVILLSKLAYHY
jgi:hypothetical protein